MPVRVLPNNIEAEESVRCFNSFLIKPVPEKSLNQTVNHTEGFRPVCFGYYTILSYFGLLSNHPDRENESVSVNGRDFLP